MSRQIDRLSRGGAIDRSRPLNFTFDGKPMTGCAGDTLASALLANGVKLVGRSFKYHRPRGIYSAGPQEPCALVELREGARREPNTPATMIELFDGLKAESQNRWPNLNFDVGAVNGLMAPFLPAGFYYKTFMWPASWWEKYEVVIRRAAGLGRAADAPDPDTYDKMAAHCDVLVVGGGPAGLAAARSAAATGARVILVDEHAKLGGQLRFERRSIDGRPAMDWVAAVEAELRANPDVLVLERTTAFGYYDHNLVACVERVQDHLPVPEAHRPRQRQWKIRATQVILAAGAMEQPLTFADNDRPGVMLAGAVRAYINGYGVLPTRRAVVVTDNDSAYETAIELADAGSEVAAVVDLRANPEGPAPARVLARGIVVMPGHTVVGIEGRKAVHGARVAPIAGGAPQLIACDLVAASGGWSSCLHLHSQSGGKVVYSDSVGSFLPGEPKQASRSVGAMAGRFTLAVCIAEGMEAGAEAAAKAGLGKGKLDLPPAVGDEDGAFAGGVRLPRRSPPWEGKCFIDLQGDVTTKDVELSAREGFLSVEHLKRYTTLGMWCDQGKSSNLAGLSLMAEQRQLDIPAVGVTTFRPPYTPVALGVLAGSDVGQHFKPLRRSPMDQWHADNGAEWIPAGLWRRPHFYPQAGEDVDSAAEREVKATRGGVGICDVTTLGKIDIQGPDAGEFLNRVYANGFKLLKVGRARYGLMLREDGIAYDDGTTSRLGEHHYLMTTTTANAVAVMAQLEYYLQVEWPDLKVQATSVTEQWAAIAIAGPQSRDLIKDLVDIDVSNEAFPFMQVAACRFAGLPARLFRISFSGELAYEVNVPADYGQAAWDAAVEAGKDLDAVAYGMEALGTMRVEKGHVAGPELNGQTTPADLGLGRMVSTKKEFIGRRLLDWEGTADPSRPAVVGLKPVDGKTWILAGAQLVKDPNAEKPIPMLGHVTSIAYSPELGTPIALALLEGGHERIGERLVAAFPLRDQNVEVEVVSPHFIDPEGSRMHA